MDRYLIRLDNSKANYTPSDTMLLLKEMRDTTQNEGCVVKNLRVTQNALEFDLYAPNQAAKSKSISNLEARFGKKQNERNLGIDETPQDKIETLRTSIQLFNEQRYWECHETMEQVWRKEPKGPEKDVQQGLILAASAMVHFQKNENDVCLNMIPRTLQKLNAWTSEKYLLLDVGKLKTSLQEIYESRKIRPFAL
jgi:uncharacterized protein